MKKNLSLQIKIALLMLAAIIYVYFFSGNFSVNKITILGQSSFPKDKILALANIDMKKNIYLINTTQIKKNLEKDNYIKSAIVKRKFPREITILIHERIPVASIPAPGGYVIIDENATALSIVQDETKIKKPLINGIQIKDVKLQDVIHVKNQDELENILKIIKYISSLNLLDNISYVDLAKLDDISMTTKSGITVRFGSIKNIEYKAKLLNQILINLSTKGKTSGTLDMRFNTDPVFYD